MTSKLPWDKSTPKPQLATATAYLNAGLSVLPAQKNEKRPACNWRPFQKRLPMLSELEAWSAILDRVCVVCGKISGNLEMIDFDMAGALFDAWKSLVDPSLLARLVIERSPSGGYHVCYRSAEPVDGNTKLASVMIDGNASNAIETRGEGGLFLCAPTEGYSLIQGTFTALPIITAEERSALLQAARSLDEDRDTSSFKRLHTGEMGRPGDQYNRTGDFRGVLTARGWRHLRSVGDNEHWQRPEKEGVGTSATIRDRVFYCFSSSASPFEPSTAYSPFAVYALLEHGGDFSAAARAMNGTYIEVADDVDLSGILGDAKPIAPVVTPIELLRCPGFISEHVDRCLERAPYPNQWMAFCAALAMQGVLAGRRVSDPGDNRTNIYICGLAYSAAGKDFPRKMNKQLDFEAGLGGVVAEAFGSGEGIEDAVERTPSMVFQTDEMHGILRGYRDDNRYRGMIDKLMTLYSSANGPHTIRALAGQETRCIYQPCMSIFGTAIPTHYYESLSPEMLTNGFFSRLVIVESGPRSEGQEPGICQPTQRMIDTAKAWAAMGATGNNLEQLFPTIKIVEHTDAAKKLIVDIRLDADSRYKICEEKSDPVGTTVWGRTSENVRKFALLYACSESVTRPEIGVAAVRWAHEFIMHLTERALSQADRYVAGNDQERQVLEVLAAIEEHSPISDRALKRRFRKYSSKQIDGFVSDLRGAGNIITTAIKPPSGPSTVQHSALHEK